MIVGEDLVDIDLQFVDRQVVVVLVGDIVGMAVGYRDIRSVVVAVAVVVVDLDHYFHKVTVVSGMRY